MFDIKLKILIKRFKLPFLLLLKDNKVIKNPVTGVRKM